LKRRTTFSKKWVEEGKPSSELMYYSKKMGAKQNTMAKTLAERAVE